MAIKLWYRYWCSFRAISAVDSSSKKELYLGDNLINSADTKISGKEVVVNNENFYKISNVK